MVHEPEASPRWPKAGSKSSLAEGAGRWHCHGPDNPIAPFLAAVRASARPLGRQGLGQRCHRHDPTGLCLVHNHTTAPKRRLMKFTRDTPQDERTRLRQGRWTGICVLRRTSAGERAEIRPDRDVITKGKMPAPERAAPPMHPNRGAGHVSTLTACRRYKSSESQ
jgi:hypothetical protein